jgi:uncharacterized membrane protein YoaK (UPF0700 family)
MKPTLRVLLSMNAGYVDTAGFLALQGLFTAHVTGNIITFAAAMVFGASEAVITKLLALPVFCGMVILVRLLGYVLSERGLPELGMFLGLKELLLIVAAGLAIHYGPFGTGDEWPAMVTGLTLVSAMAIQNAVHRTHLGNTPPTTLMTGNLAQLMIDFIDMLRGPAKDRRAGARAHLRHMAAGIVAFVTGCAAAAILYANVDTWCFVIPPLIGLQALVARGSALRQDGALPAGSRSP